MLLALLWSFPLHSSSQPSQRPISNFRSITTVSPPGNSLALQFFFLPSAIYEGVCAPWYVQMPQHWQFISFAAGFNPIFVYDTCAFSVSNLRSIHFVPVSSHYYGWLDPKSRITLGSCRYIGSPLTLLNRHLPQKQARLSVQPIRPQDQWDPESTIEARPGLTKIRALPANANVLLWLGNTRSSMLSPSTSAAVANGWRQRAGKPCSLDTSVLPRLKICDGL